MVVTSVLIGRYGCDSTGKIARSIEHGRDQQNRRTDSSQARPPASSLPRLPPAADRPERLTPGGRRLGLAALAGLVSSGMAVGPVPYRIVV
jgi:hypothetical protein